ncbi:MAG TPA: hypothetical protein VEC06_05145 [Paucimonas sp.]|nr:hypothetical protein [Paucimonas sp.]
MDHSDIRQSGGRRASARGTQTDRVGGALRGGALCRGSFHRASLLCSVDYRDEVKWRIEKEISIMRQTASTFRLDVRCSIYCCNEIDSLHMGKKYQNTSNICLSWLRIGIFILLLFFTLLHHDKAMSADGLISEILSLPKPSARVTPTIVDSIVKKYIPVGMDKALAFEKLKSEGFVVIEKEMTLNACQDCEKIVIHGGYIKKPWLLFLPYEVEISIILGFKDERVSYISGKYMRVIY